MNLILGTANFLINYGFNNHKNSKKTINELINESKKIKIKELDTAFDYDRFLKMKIKEIKEFKINSKIKIESDRITNKNYINELIQSIKLKLEINNLENFNIIFIHNFSIFKKKNQFIFLNRVLRKLKDFNLTNKVGLSLYEAKELKYLKYFDNIDYVQIPLNVLNRGFSRAKLIEIKKKKIKIHVRSVFLQGLLLEDSDKINLKKDIFKKLEKWQTKNYISKIEMSINFINYYQKYIDGIVVGVDDFNQLREINKILKKKKKVFPRLIFTSNKKIIDPRVWNA